MGKETSSSPPPPPLRQQLPWLWIVEALAEFEPVNAAILDDMMSEVGGSPRNPWGRRARERLALRHLENLFRNEGGAIDDQPSNFNISVSDPAHHVALRVAQRLAAANGATSVLELLRSDVSRFILQKRAILPKPTLLQLKDQIGKVGQVSSNFFGEISGLGRDHQEEEIVQDAILPSAERETSNCSGQENICGGSGDNCLDAEKTSENAESGSVENNENPVHVNELKHFPSKGKLPADINEANESSKDPRGPIPVDGSDDIIFPIAKKIRLSTSETDSKANELKMNENAVEIQDVSSSGESYPNGHVGRADDNCTEPEATSTKAGHLDRPSSSVPDEDATNVAVKESLSGFQSVLNQDSDGINRHFCIKCNEGGQLLICSVSSCGLAAHKSCLASAGSFDEAGNYYCPFCSLAQATAAYREVKRKVALVKEKAALARSRLIKFMNMVNAHREQTVENTSMEELNRPKDIEDMNDIVEVGILQLKKIMCHQPNSERKHQHKMEVDGNFANGSAFQAGASISPSNEKTYVSHNREHVTPDKNHQDARNFITQEPLEPATKSCDDFRQENEERAVINQKIPDVSLKNNEEKMTEEEGQQSQTNIGNEIEQGVPTDTIANTSCAGATIGFAGQDHASAEKENAVPQHKEEPAKTHVSLETENSVSQQNEELVDAHVFVETENVVQRQNKEPAHDPPSFQNLGIPEASTSENDDSTSFEFRKRQRRVVRHTNQSSPNSRRRKVPWTTEEEVKLKEGVRRFSSADGKNIPWKKILLYGQDVFQESRTAIDLKDKWRNIWHKEGRRALE